jgi:hypothetical protein
VFTTGWSGLIATDTYTWTLTAAFLWQERRRNTVDHDRHDEQGNW